MYNYPAVAGGAASAEEGTTVSEGEPTGEAGGEAAGVDRRQVALVALCLLGLVVAAFVAPVAPDASAFGSGDGGEGGGGGDGGDSGGAEASGSSGGAGGGEGSGSGGGRGGDASGDGGGRVISEDGDPIPVPGGDAPPTDGGGGVVIENEPVPGGTVRLSVYDDLKPADGVPVWFGDRFVGRTDPTGRVSGRTPYTRELNVTVRLPGADCEFFRRPYDTGADGDDRSSVRDASLDAGLGLDATVSGGSPAVRAQETAGNDTGTYAVGGSVTFSVLGDPYPGTNVTVAADVEGVPMRRAAVSVDGERVGRTNAEGRHDLAVPTDAEDVSVTVERGDFSGSTTVDVWLLDAAIVPQEGLPVPGEPALVTAAAGPAPAADARVTLDGTGLGIAGENGTVAFALPADPRGTVAVETERQSTTAPLWTAYAPTIAASALLLVVGVVAAAVAARVRDRSAARRVAAWWVAVATLFVGLAVGEGGGLLAAVGLVALGAAVSHRRAVGAGGRTVGERVRAFVAWARRTALAVADRVAAAIDALAGLSRRIAARFAALPLSVRGLTARLWGWTRALPGRARRSLAIRFTLRRAAVALVATGLLAALTARFGALGFLGGVVGLWVGVVAYRRWAREDGDAGDGPAEGGRSTGAAGTSGAAGDANGRERRSIRALWRRFARWVRPRRWRQSTPGEVSRAAVERGLPERPVRALTDAFREVEYGDRNPDDEGERAREAFESIEREREDES